MNVFVINSGSSSIKYQLIRMPGAEVACTGLVDRIGQQGSTVSHKAFKNGAELARKEAIPIPDHAAGLEAVAALLADAEVGVIADPSEIHTVGHRAVHGAESFSSTMEITQEVMDKMKELFPLAPLHNPPNHLGIQVAASVFPAARQVAVFDTAFHQSMPPVAFRMAIPHQLYVDHKIRNYGFHGTSHKFVSERAAEFLGKPDAKIVTIHLGNGCSMAAVQGGKCMDTTMGMGPMNGLMMGSRAGDIDQSVIFHLISQLGYTPAEVNNMLNKQSGMLGLTGFNDMRDVKKLYYQGDKQAVLAYNMYAYRIKKYIGAYAAILNGIDAVVFTAGVGENDPLSRSLTCLNMEYIGLHLDEAKNESAARGIRDISADGSPVRILVVPTNEELEIAKQCYELLSPNLPNG